ncbi:MAG: hypothetical protein OEV49_01905 [candidate division Zixibacteria bacterium]|nr:hypothetical protein [candidate division Zixibacteria bacterium]MDH3938746.1 hypothetical protein [candidate division Zixibacteria bacterium]MDH4033320.1 hypothetical protein [candidate division Zixibacteria bacterium]
MYTRYLSTIVITILSIAASAAGQSERISLYDFAAAYPQSMPTFVGDGNAPMLQRETIVAIDLQIDADGVVSNVLTAPTAHARLAKYIDPYLKQIKFAPAKLNDQEVSSTLPVEVLLWPGDRWPIFTFPVDSLGHLNNRRLYDHCLEQNDITQPRVTRFGSYYATPNVDTTAGSYRYVLFAIDLDATGAVLERRIVRSTYPVFDEQVLTAILWSEFAPASVKGRSIPSSLYLLVSFFGPEAYPTPVWPPNPDSTSNPLEFLRLRSFADQSGLMSLPLPQRLPSYIYPLGADPVLHRDTVSARVQIDTLGQCRFMGSEQTNSEIRSVLGRIVPKIKFFPALDFQGRAQNYSGRAVFEFTGEANVRVHCAWLR